MDTITKRSGTRIDVNVYKKSTNTDRYLDFNSHHPVCHKRSVVCTLLRKAKSIPSTQEGKRKETKRVKSVLRENNYPPSFINKCERSLSKPQTDIPANGFVVLPYVQGISEKIDRILRQEEIKVAYKLLKTLMTTQSATRLAYSKLVAEKSTAPTQSQQKWMNECDITNAEDIEWQETYQLASKCTKSTSLKEFQFKFLHRRISTNDFLYKIGINNDSKCPKTESFWADVTSRLTQCKINLNNNSLEYTVAMGLTPDSSQYYNQINFCCLLARHFIWLCHTKETIPHIDGFRRYLKLAYDTEQITKTTTPKK
ncbi:hypothetical protein ACROYT_G033639 [Oculina patagonica]